MPDGRHVHRLHMRKARFPCFTKSEIFKKNRPPKAVTKGGLFERARPKSNNRGGYSKGCAIHPLSRKTPSMATKPLVKFRKYANSLLAGSALDDQKLPPEPRT